MKILLTLLIVTAIVTNFFFNNQFTVVLVAFAFAASVYLLSASKRW